MSDEIRSTSDGDTGEVTPIQLSACLFVAALAQDIDARKGIVTSHGTPETQAKVIKEVRRQFFEDGDEPLSATPHNEARE